jgi:hypothetical protein
LVWARTCCCIRERSFFSSGEAPNFFVRKKNIPSTVPGSPAIFYEGKKKKRAGVPDLFQVAAVRTPAKLLQQHVFFLKPHMPLLPILFSRCCFTVPFLSFLLALLERFCGNEFLDWCPRNRCEVVHSVCTGPDISLKDRVRPVSISLSNSSSLRICIALVHCMYD